MHDFQWVITDFLMQHLHRELLVTLAVLLAVIAVTAVFVAVELRRSRKQKDDNADQ